MRRIIGGDEIAQKIEEIEEIAKENFEAAKEKETEKVVDLYKGKRAVTAFQRSKHPTGIPPSFENALIAVDMLGAECRYDVFHDKIIVRGHECGVRGDAHENLENVTLKVRQTVLARFGFDPSTGYTMDAIKARCLDNIFDPVRDYLDGLQWDGISRIDDWLVRYCGAQDTLLNRAIGRKMLIAAVRRVRRPGCKFDYIVVFESKYQGIGKSSVLKILAGEDNFSDNEIIGLDKKEQQESLQGVWIYEMAELEGLHKADVTRVKLFASKTADMARPAYGRSRVDRPRRCIIVATTNEDTYLRDTTGNRRFWPVKLWGVIRTEEDDKYLIDLAAVERDRDQLWAEATMLEAGGEPLVIPENLWPDVAAEQQARMEPDAWEGTLSEALAGLVRRGEAKRAKDCEPLVINGKFSEAADSNGDPEWRVSSDYLLSEVMWLPKERQNNVHTKRLATVMRSLGWERCEKTIRIGYIACRGYRLPTGEKLGKPALSSLQAGVSEIPSKVTRVTGKVNKAKTTISPITPTSFHSKVIPVTPVTTFKRRI